MKKINREPLVRTNREAVTDSREIREHLAELQEIVDGLSTATQVIDLRARESGTAAEIITGKIPAYDSDGFIIGYIPVFWRIL